METISLDKEVIEKITNLLINHSEHWEISECWGDTYLTYKEGAEEIVLILELCRVNILQSKLVVKEIRFIIRQNEKTVTIDKISSAVLNKQDSNILTMAYNKFKQNRENMEIQKNNNRINEISKTLKKFNMFK